MTAADQLGSPLGGRLWPVTKKYWVLFAVLGTVAVCLYSTGTEWTLLNLQATSLSVGVHNKPHALNHLTSSGDSLGETANDTPDKNTTSSVEPSSSPPLSTPSTAHSPSTATTPSTGERIITREHVAIVAYVPPGMPKFVREAQHMLWSSWNYSVHQVDPSTRGNTDLIFFAHHDVVDGMPASCVRLVDISHAPSKSSSTSSAADRCYVVEHTPPADAYWHRYNFMFSLSFLAEPAYEPLLMSYDRLLRTDTDVVITPAFLTFRPRQFVVGRGGYMIEEYTKTRIKQLATDLHMTHQSLYNVGSTWFGNTSVTLLMVPKMLDVAKFILESPKYNQDEGFPRWHPNVASMYAGELVVNHFIPKENVWVNLDSLDINCNGHEKTADVYHSHCWPGEYQGYFKKWAFERGEYTPVTFPRDKLDIAVINDYFMAMAVYGY
ncbi:hypothetical protein DYB38_007952 [Aphanomyces astaci]|uniref:DUF7164 domain-containing protein n=1 Tax=Aphanomyces astaci TaxID=112090 RepID=A0A397DG63_APHAT|nr:hypothetical protein DYB38_007952 [Aphanomyces astaci]RHY68525.1 hypothetical protein DYB34_007975 [Aphanomyces astaci]